MRLSRLLCCLLATLALGCAWMVLAQAETAGVNGLFTNDQPSLSGSRDSLGSGSNGHSSGPGLKLVKTFQNGRKYVNKSGRLVVLRLQGSFTQMGWQYGGLMWAEIGKMYYEVIHQYDENSVICPDISLKDFNLSQSPAPARLDQGGWIPPMDKDRPGATVPIIIGRRGPASLFKSDFTNVLIP